MIAKVDVIENRVETPSTRTVRFTKPRGFDFRPVQFVGLELETQNGAEEYSMSIACSPTKDFLEFGARISPSPWKQAFAALRPGDQAEIDGPYGHFVLDEARDAVFVAGGIGITPLKGMIEYATDKRLDRKLVLIYSNRTPEEIAYRDHLEALARANPKLTIEHTITRPEGVKGWKGRVGRIDEAMLRRADTGSNVFYLCGLPGMVQDAAGALLRMGVPRERITYEAFWGYD